jgi:NAD(P)-dependent dehydrogenase (short-subunit alcohol dehydrogenase family)
MFRPELLAGRRVAFAGADETPAAIAVDELGGAIELVPEGLEVQDELQAWVAARLPLHGLVFDARPRFGAGGLASLTAALERAWVVARAVATEALIPARAGRLIFIAPQPEAGPYAEAARAGLENLARTLSIEWARFTVTAVALNPGTPTTEDELTGLVSFLLSEAGAYLTGCRFDLGTAAAGAPSAP